MGVTKKVVKSNRLLVKNGNLIIVDQQGKKYGRFNLKSFPTKTEIYEFDGIRETIEENHIVRPPVKANVEISRSTPKKKPTAKRELSWADALFRAILFILGSGAVLGIIDAFLKHK